MSIGFADDSELTAGAFREEVNANVSHAETMDRWMVRSYKKPTSSGKSGESQRLFVSPGGGAREGWERFILGAIETYFFDYQ